MRFFDRMGYFLIVLYIFSCLVWSYIPEKRYLYYICSLVLGVALGIDLVKHKFRILRTPMNSGFIIFILIGLLSAFWGINFDNSFEQFVSLVINYLYIVLMMNYVHHRNAGLKLLTMLCASGILMSVYYILTEGVGTLLFQMLSGQRIGKELGNENVIGAFAAFSAILSIYFYRCEKSKKWIFTLPATVFVALGSGSRMVLILLFLGTLGTLLIAVQRVRPMKILIGVLVALGVFWVLLNLPMFSSVSERFNDLLLLIQSGETESNSMDYRQIMIEEGLKSFWAYPFTGVGLGNTGALIAHIILDKNYPYLHNNYVELLASVGVFGTLAYYSVYFFSLKKLLPFIRNGERPAKIMMLLTLLLLVNDISNVTYYKSMFYIPLFMPMVYSSVYAKRLMKGNK